MLTMTYPDGRLVTYTRDGIGRIIRVTTDVEGESTTLLDGLAYRADGLVTAQSFGNGLDETRAYDQQGRLISQFLGGADTRVYAYDANANLTVKQTLPMVGTYAYDSLDRLTEETLTNDEIKTLSYSYDPNGNRLTRTNDTKTKTYAYTPDTNRLEGINNKDVVLDAAGNTLSDRNGRRRFEYNQAGRLARFLRNDQLKASYVYNYLNQRTRKVRVNKNGLIKTFIYHYDLSGNLIAETREDGKPIRDYIWVNATPIAQSKVRRTKKGVLRQKQLLYLYSDHLNTPRLATDATQTVVWRWAGDAFGITQPDKDPDADGNKVNVRLRFPGQYHDGESTLYYNWNRYYDPKTGRYITSDPIGLDGGINTYLYALANTFKHGDPAGLVTWTGDFDIKALSIWIGGAVATFELTSGCIDGRKAKIAVEGRAFIGLNVGILPPSQTKGSIALEDHKDYLDPYSFSGAFELTTVGPVVGPVDFFTRIRLGDAWSRSVNARGLDLSIFSGANGRSALVGPPTYEQCECKDQ
jgi:RHS repeat-associated protein